MPADVTYQRGDYQYALPLWAQIETTMAGEHAVKA